MSVDSLLDSALTTLLGKAIRDAEAEGAITPRTATINFSWGGGGQPLVLTNTDPILVEVPFPSKIIWAHLYAGDAAGQPAVVTASVEVRITQFSSFGGSLALYGSGTAPALTAASRADLDVTNWQVNLLTGDALIARLTAFTGSADWIALVLLIRSVDDALITVVDTSGDQFVDTSGNPFVIRG
jgi:hypothetical protein